MHTFIMAEHPEFGKIRTVEKDLSDTEATKPQNHFPKKW